MRNIHNKEGFRISMTNRLPLLALSLMALMAPLAHAQTLARPAIGSHLGGGPTAAVEFGGTSNQDGQVYELNPNVGYDFNSHFGAVLGTPFYFVSPSSTAGGSSSSGVGDPYLSLHLNYPNPGLNYATALTGAAPAGDSKKGFSTGRPTYDWTNRFDREFSSITPFVEIGFSNSIADTRYFLRPYTTLGFNTHLLGGASCDLSKFFSVGASGYDIIPVGDQTVFSRVAPGQARAGTASHGRVFQNNQQTKGGASIAQDDGFSAAVNASPGHTLDLEVAYTRSLAYDLNSVSFDIGINLTRLVRGNGR